MCAMSRNAWQRYAAKRDDPGIATGGQGREQLQVFISAYYIEQSFATRHHATLDLRYSYLGQQRQACLQCLNPKHVRAAALETTGVVRHFPGFSAEVSSVLDHMPAELMQGETVAPLRPAIKNGDAFRAE